MAYAHGACAGAAAAVGGGKGFVHVKVHHVKAHVAHPHLAQDGVHIGAVVVEQGVHAVEQLHNAGQVGFHEAQSVGAGHHDAGQVFAVFGHGRGHGLRVHHAVARRQVHGLKARQGRRGRIGAVGRVGNEHFFAVASLGLVVGGNELHAREFAVGPGHGLKGEGPHARDFAEQGLGLAQALQRALHAGGPPAGLGQQGMRAAEARQRGHIFREFGVVLHGAGAKGVKIGVHTVVALRKLGKVAHHVQLRALGQAGRTGAQQGLGQHVRGLGGVAFQAAGATAGHGFGEDGVHSRPPTASASMPI